MIQSNGAICLDDLIASRRVGHSMPQEFYTDAAVHLADMERIFRGQWVFVGHSCQIIEAGEFFTVTIGADPLMGDYKDADVGTMRCRTMPNMWNHSSCDHVVSTRLLPTAANRTQARVMWLVHPDAEEGRDYELEELMPFWQLTSEQDWELCEFAQTGISSSAYRPGPYSTHKEYNVDAFVRWYLEALAQ